MLMVSVTINKYVKRKIGQYLYQVDEYYRYGYVDNNYMDSQV